MVDRLLSIFVATLVLIGASFALVIFLHSDPATGDLDQDLHDVRARIAEAVAHSNKYEGGLIKVLIDARAEVLRNTEDMLQMKRYSALRRVNLNYNVPAIKAQDKPERSLEEIQRDIDEAKKRTAEAEQKAAQYSGGLVQVMSLATVATQELTLAQLQLAFYSTKYGLPVLIPSSPLGENTEKSPKPAGRVVRDRDAL